MSDTPSGPSAAAVSAAPLPVAGFADWQRLVERALDGRSIAALASRTRDDIRIEPLYPRAGDRQPLLMRARSWGIVQAVDDPDPDSANAQALVDVEGGATGLALRFADPPDAASGLPPTKASLGIALDAIDLARIEVRLEPHPDGQRLAGWLADLIFARGFAPELAKAAFGLDPVAASLAQEPRTPAPAAYAGSLLELRAAGFRGPLAILDGRRFHAAGCTEAQELATVLSAAAWWLRTLAASHLSPREALPLLETALAADQDVLVSVAKLRAMRLLWARLGEVCGEPGAVPRLHAETSRRMLTRAEPHNNLLRNALAAFAAGTGGADSLAIVPHSAGSGLADAGARALARNLHHLLLREAHLDRVADPLAGSGAVEALTGQLAERAWAEFQTIEAEGGILASLSQGGLAARIATARDALGRSVAAGSPAIVGVTAYAASGTAVATGPTEPGGLSPITLEDLARAAA